MAKNEWLQVLLMACILPVLIIMIQNGWYFNFGWKVDENYIPRNCTDYEDDPNISRSANIFMFLSCPLLNECPYNPLCIGNSCKEAADYFDRIYQRTSDNSLLPSCFPQK